VEDEEGAGHAVLLHEVLSLVDLAQLELLQQQLLDLLVLDQRREREVRLEALQDQRLVVDRLLLDDLYKVLIDLVVVDGPQRPHLPRLPLPLNKMMLTS
jgi:hypothetical protein